MTVTTAALHDALHQIDRALAADDRTSAVLAVDYLLADLPRLRAVLADHHTTLTEED